MLTVEKIGGTSMSALKEVLENIIFYKKTGDECYNRVFVVSAFAGVTDMLLENKKTGSPGIYHKIIKHQDYRPAMAGLLGKLKSINKGYQALGLDLHLADTFVDNHISKALGYLDNLVNVLSSGYVSKTGILLAAREILASIGESHSAFVLSDILRHRGLSVHRIDLGGFDDHATLTIDQRIKKAFKEVSLSRTICIVTGYTKGTEGIMREFDRGYSEVTFSKIAGILRPDEAVIHKEYHLSTADPAIVGTENCVPVGFTNYDIADQLADVGMEAIHPSASKPLETKGISLRIKNTFDPSHQGTLISKSYLCERKRIEMITGTNKLILIDVYDALMVGSVGSDLKAMQILAHHNISYTFKTTSANSISMLIWEKDFKKGLINDLQREFEKVSHEKVAIVCLLGSNIDQPGLLAKSSSALSGYGINIKAAGFALRKVNIQFILERADYEQAIIALNRAMQ